MTPPPPPPHDILFIARLGIELLRAAQEYLLPNLTAQVEEVLVEKVSNETAIDLYHASSAADTSRLNIRCAMFVLFHYETLVQDEPDEKLQTLLHILDNVDPKIVFAVAV